MRPKPLRLKEKEGKSKRVENFFAFALEVPSGSGYFFCSNSIAFSSWVSPLAFSWAKDMFFSFLG